MKSWSYFIFTIIVSMTLAEVPSYINVCGRRNRNLDKCILDSVNALREKLRIGIPEIQVPAIEPLELEKGLPLTTSKDLMAFATNVKLYNIHTFKVHNLHIDLDKQRLDIHISLDSVRLTGDYNITTKILVPVSGYGPVDIRTNAIDGKGILMYKFINSKRGQRVFFSEMTCKLSVAGYTSKFIATEGPDDTFAEVINTIINEQQQEIIESITPQLEMAISTRVLEIANRISGHFTYDELLPDRE